MIVTIIGGARSGKSKFAEGYFSEGSILYIATGRVLDEEMEERVRIHKSRRPSTWGNFEEALSPVTNLDFSYDNYLLDDITNLLTNILFDEIGEGDIDELSYKKIETRVLNEIEALITELKERGKNLLMVTNEVGLSIVPENKLSRKFRDLQGNINQYLAEKSDKVHFILSGLEMRLK